MKSVKAYVVAGLAVLFAAAQAAVLVAVSGATLARPARPESDTLSALTPPEEAPTAVWVGNIVAGLGVARVDSDHLILAGAPQRIEHRSGWDGAVVVPGVAPGGPHGRWWLRGWVGARRVATAL